MPDAEVRFESELVEAYLARGRALPSSVIMKYRDCMMMIGMRIQARSQERSPRDSGTLMRSHSTTGRRRGADWLAEVTIGGLASKYVEVQHENPDLTHTSAAWRAKYGLMKPTRKFPGGHKGGQAHFLHGSGTSAWNPTAQRWAMMQLAAVGQTILDKEFGP